MTDHTQNPYPPGLMDRIGGIEKDLALLKQNADHQAALLEELRRENTARAILTIQGLLSDHDRRLVRLEKRDEERALEVEKLERRIDASEDRKGGRVSVATDFAKLVALLGAIIALIVGIVQLGGV